MNLKIKQTNTYELELFEEPELEKLVPLTQKNSDFIEGCIKIDSSYDSTATEECIKNMLNHFSKKNIKKAVEEINALNSTRLSDEEMKTMTMRILSFKKTEFDNYFKEDKTDEIFKKLADSIEFKTKGNKKRSRINISFATKFIYHVSKIKGTIAHQKYSKYDSKVAECLPDYMEAYCNEKHTIEEFKRKNNNINNIWDMYLNYNECITRLIEQANKTHCCSFERDEIDHLIWYTHK